MLPASETVPVPLDARQVRWLQARAEREGRTAAELLGELVGPHLGAPDPEDATPEDADREDVA